MPVMAAVFNRQIVLHNCADGAIPLHPNENSADWSLLSVPDVPLYVDWGFAGLHASGYSKTKSPQDPDLTDAHQTCTRMATHVVRAQT